MGTYLTLYRVPEAETRGIAAASEKVDPIDSLLGTTEDDSFAEVPTADLCKSYQILHFLLTGMPYMGEPPWNFLMSGGDIDGVAYSVDAMLSGHSTASVRSFAGAVRGLTTAGMAARFTPEMMGRMALAGIYPSNLLAATFRRPPSWPPRPRDHEPPLDEADHRFIAEHFDELHRDVVAHYDTLREFTMATAEQGMGLLSWIC